MKNEMKRKPSIGVIGCGYWGKNLVRNLSELGCLAAVADNNADTVKLFSEQYEVKGHTFDSLLADTAIQGVMIASPAELHFQHVSKALKAGKHVFVEKPLALSTEEGQLLCDLAKSTGRTLMVGHLLQYHAAYIKAKSMVQEGDIGKLQYLYSNRLNLGKFRQEENSLWSFAPHDISMILGIAGKPERVFATGASHLSRDIEDITTTHMTFKHDVQAHVFVSWLHPYKEQKCVIVGDQGMLVFDDGKDWDEKLMHYSHKVKWISGVPTPDKAEGKPVSLTPSEPLKEECLHFYEMMISGEKPRTDGEEGLSVLTVLNAAQKSMKTQQIIQLNDGIKNHFVHDTARVDDGSEIGEGCKIWHYSHILKGVKLANNCNIGQNVMIGPDVNVGEGTKIQNNVSLYKGVQLGKYVFCGPSCVFTNVKNPRAHVNRQDHFLQTTVGDYVTIGANATIVCGLELGAYSFIAAGAVVTKDVPPHALMVGNPAKQLGWVSHAGERLTSEMLCPMTQKKYHISKNQLVLEEEVS